MYKMNSKSSSITSATMSIFSKIYLPFEWIAYIQEYTNINNLLITCKYFELYRVELFDWKLSKISSEKYYNAINFRHSILNRMKYPNKQLSLKLSYCTDITDVSALGTVHTLN